MIATTAKAEDATSLAPTVSETKEETLAEADSVVLAKTSDQPSESSSVSESTSFLHLRVRLLRSVNPRLCL